MEPALQKIQRIAERKEAHGMVYTVYMIVSLALLAVATLAVWEAVGGIIAWKMLYADHHNFSERESPSDCGIPATSLRIPVDADHDLAAWILTPDPSTTLGGACVVMVHGYDSGKDKVWEYPDDNNYRSCTLDQGARTLWQAGFHVVAIDLRNHGESSNNGPVTLGAKESDDVLAVVDFLVQNAGRFGIDPNRIGLRGESMGGATCLIAAAKDKHNQIAAVWSDSAYARADTAILDFMVYKNLPVLFGHPARRWLVRLTGVNLDQASPVAGIDQINCPVFIVHSTGDRMLPTRHFDQLVNSDRWSQRPDSMLLTTHQHNRLWREPGYHDRQIQFFAQSLAVDKNVGWLQNKAA